MQVNYPSTGEILIFVWFGVSVFVEVVGSFVFWFWLRRRGVKLTYELLAGIPGCMEYAYLEWCRSQGHSGTRVLTLRAISIINVIVAGIVFIRLLTAV
jgi:hypothetical protein